jgi:hypothetical protein
MKEIKMKIKILVLGAAVAAFTFTSYAQSGAAAQLRSPAANPSVADATITTIAYVNSVTPISPRAQANQSKIIQGTADTSGLALACRKGMVASPKAVAECASHATMPGCTTVAMLK